MLEDIARLALTAPRRVLGAAAIVLVCAAILGFPEMNRLSAGGFEDSCAALIAAHVSIVRMFGAGLTLASGDGRDLGAHVAGAALHACLGPRVVSGIRRGGAHRADSPRLPTTEPRKTGIPFGT